MPPPAPAVGELIAGKYRIESLIGEGGMGTVLAAHHELLDVRVALKLLTPRLVRNRSLVNRFVREAQAAARLKSEHVARVMDVGTLPGGQPYIVMDLLEGEDLEHKLERVGRVPIHYAVDCLLQALEAMAHAHAAGIVHRDLKPANLFVTLTADGREVIKVLDFGIAKLTDASTQGFGARSGALTDEHATLGSPSYMAPEQVRASRQIDHRADIWALGTILYELVTGHVAFGGQSLGEIFGAVLHERPAPLRQHRPEAPAELERVVNRCLERDPGGRFGDVAEVATAIAPFGSGAWVGHVGRIGQTLARAGKASLSEARSAHRSELPSDGAAGASEPTTPIPASSQSSPRAFSRAAAAAETLAEPVEAQVATGRRSVAFAVVASLASGVALVAVLVPMHPWSRSRAAIPSTVASVEPIASVAPPLQQVSLTPNALLFPPPSAMSQAAPAIASATSPTQIVRHHAAKPAPARVAPTPKTGASQGPRLPGILSSPE